MSIGCNTVTSHTGLLNNCDYFLRPGIFVALSQINFTSKIKHIKHTNIVNIYCDSLDKGQTNPTGLLRCIPLTNGKNKYMFNFQDELLFLKITDLKPYIQIKIDSSFEIKYLQLIIE